MNSLSSGRVADTLQQLFKDAERADEALIERFGNVDPEQMVTQHLMAERKDLRSVYRGYVNNFLNVTPEYGRFLYQCARSRKATRIVEFGTSMGISTVFLAAALRDMGGGHLISTELEPQKAGRAQANLEAAGLADLVEIRVGDARETLENIAGEVDLVLLDGAFTLYLPVLKLLEPHLSSGTPVLAENAFDHDNEYLDYVRDPANGYLSQPLEINPGRGNEFSVRTDRGRHLRG
ncbi:O-methyltransferase [Pseudomonas tolaasii]|uniref:O-methyltransferase n=1 Tax=Pseudomonas tolaasii TaxID=29442 RepID=UPI00030D2877|nr:class I SAM-dependent methyltransferase [Pseudomonas tolaasii]